MPTKPVVYVESSRVVVANRFPPSASYRLPVTLPAFQSASRYTHEPTVAELLDDSFLPEDAQARRMDNFMPLPVQGYLVAFPISLNRED